MWRAAPMDHLEPVTGACRSPFWILRAAWFHPRRFYVSSPIWIWPPFRISAGRCKCPFESRRMRLGRTRLPSLGRPVRDRLYTCSALLSWEILGQIFFPPLWGMVRSNKLLTICHPRKRLSIVSVMHRSWLRCDSRRRACSRGRARAALEDQLLRDCRAWWDPVVFAAVACREAVACFFLVKDACITVKSVGLCLLASVSGFCRMREVRGGNV